jgi:Flp pilus assembly CpaF family ATPase
VALETVEPYEAGAHPVTIGDLVRNALRQTPDRIIVGEVRGEEAFFLLRAFSTGHGGGFGTIHSNDAEDGLHQLQLLAQMAPVAGLTAPVVASMVGRAVDVVIYQRHFQESGARRIVEVIEREKPGVAVGPSGEVGYPRQLQAQEPAALLFCSRLCIEQLRHLLPGPRSGRLRRLDDLAAL